MPADMEEVMPSLQAYLDWETFGVLPTGGGTYDQDPDVMEDFRHLHGVFAEWRREHPNEQ